jgi:hypothetical protein
MDVVFRFVLKQENRNLFVSLSKSMTGGVCIYVYIYISKPHSSLLILVVYVVCRRNFVN